MVPSALGDGHEMGTMAVPERFRRRATTWKEWWAGTGLNRRHQDFQSCALPTELPAHHEFSTIPEGLRRVKRGRHASRANSATTASRAVTTASHASASSVANASRLE